VGTVIGCLIRLRETGFWVVRASDLVNIPRGHQYWRVEPVGPVWTSHPVYGTLILSFASVWRFQKPADNFILRNGLIADLFWTEIEPTGKVTSDGRKHLIAVG
tara:strand:- start:1228 stop:1536 length:309 start_codon:yes stop_codon:yes gene_type:complete